LVTAITGLVCSDAEAKALLKQLKAAAGTGGSTGIMMNHHDGRVCWESP
jgi:translation initiation factor 1 (eIF-1/SUI1)